MSEGDLLIGGMTLRHLACELKTEYHPEESRDWQLAGNLLLDSQHQQHLQVGRRYRLQLSDGRAGQVMISRLQANAAAHLIAEFEPTSVRK